jgi:hypothetical protein
LHAERATKAVFATSQNTFVLTAVLGPERAQQRVTAALACRQRNSPDGTWRSSISAMLISCARTGSASTMPTASASHADQKLRLTAS